MTKEMIPDREICILGVDDRPANLIALEAVLETLGITFVKANSGQEALEYVLKREFALILMDVQMPDMDGFETASLMRSSKKTEHIPIIFVTAINFEQKHVFKGYDSGAVDYLFKPIDPGVLRSKVKVFIDLFRQKEILKHRAEELEKANRHILRQQKALEVGAVRFRAAFEQSFQFMAILDADGRVLELNALAKQLCDTARQDPAGQFLWDIWRFEGQEQNLELKAIIEKAIAGEFTNDEASLYNAGREMLSFLRTVTPVRDEAGDIMYIAVQGQDISAWKKAEEERRRLEIQLRQAQKMEAIGTLAGGISHDFNNILSIIIGSSEMAKKADGGIPNFDRHLDRILMAANKAKDLIKQILLFSRQSEIKRVSFHPVTIVREAVRLLRSSMPASIEIRQEIDSQCGPVFADPTQFHQILLNLCTNGFHAMEASGGILTISLAASSIHDPAVCARCNINAGDYIRLTVRDTGVGISPENLARIFDPYFSTKEAGKGTGMGLAIVHGIVKNYGGCIEVESELAKGSAFNVYIPAITSQADEADRQTAPVHAAGESILLIDDDEVLLEMTKVMIEGLGYKVTTEQDSSLALKQFRKHPDAYDLVIVNQTMPGLTGAELSQKMLEIRPGLPILLCPGGDSRISRKKARDLGLAGLVYKPLVLEEISKIIRDTLHARRAESIPATGGDSGHAGKRESII